MKQLLIFFILCFSFSIGYSQWANDLPFPQGIEEVNPHTGTDPEIRNNNPDFIFDDTNGSCCTSIIFQDNGQTEAIFAYDNEGEFLFGPSESDPSANLKIGTDGTLRSFKSGALLFNQGDEVIWYNDDYFSWGFGGNFNYFSDDVIIGNRTNPVAPPANVKLHVENGRVAAETVQLTGGIINPVTHSTGYDFYTGTTSVGGINYFKAGISPAGGVVSIVNNTNGDIAMTAGGSRRITVKNTGFVGINDASPSFTLDVNGDGNFTGELMAASDVKLKKDIVAISQATNTIKELKPVTYEFRTEEFPDLKLSQGQRWGLLAQDVEQVLPDLVSSNGSATHANGEEMEIKSVNYIDMIPLLIKSIQEQDERIQAQDDKIRALEAQLKDK